MGYGEPLLLGEMSTSVLSRAMPLTWLSRRSNLLFLLFTPWHTAAPMATIDKIARCHRLPTACALSELPYLCFCRFDPLRCARIGWICSLFDTAFSTSSTAMPRKFLSSAESEWFLFFFVRCHGVEPCRSASLLLSFLVLFSLLSSLLCFQCSFFLCERWTGPFPSGVMSTGTHISGFATDGS